MSTLTARRTNVKARCKLRTPRLADRKPLAEFEEREVTLREAIWQVRQARYVAISCKLNGRNFAVEDVTRTFALRMLRKLRGRVATVQLADIFGTLVIG